MSRTLSALFSLALLAVLTACGGAVHDVSQPDQFKVTESLMHAARIGHTATLLKSGKVLIVGGWTGEREVGEIELYDPATMKFQVVGKMDPLSQHAAIMLEDGNVLVTGGARNGYMSSEALIIDTDTFRAESIGYMNLFRTDHTMTEFPDHSILVVGGAYDQGGQAELFNPYSRRFTLVGSTTYYRRGHSAVLMDANHVFVTGGYYDNTIPRAEVFSRWNNSFGTTPGAIEDQLSQQATTLKDGRILLTGYLDVVRVFNPDTGYSEDLAKMQALRQYHTVTLLGDGRLLIMGTFDYSKKVAELYTVGKTGDVSVQPKIWRNMHVATQLNDGSVLLTGGVHYKNEMESEITPTAELFIPGRK